MGFGHDENEVGLVGGFGCEGLALVAGKVGAPRIYGSQDGRPTLEEIDRGFEAGRTRAFISTAFAPLP